MYQCASENYFTHLRMYLPEPFHNAASTDTFGSAAAGRVAQRLLHRFSPWQGDREGR
ncbi:hypothetical protein DFQ13_109202 [Actinokineospora spheciospongiae]|nr:hypothetical protein DFQ13_109202 [Actinokineospora spheciospongiae]